MEFNKTTTNSAVTSNIEVIADKVTLVSPKVATINSISNAVELTIKNNNDSTITVSHDVTKLNNEFDKDLIKTSLVNIYGKTGKLYSSSRNIESANISLAQFPIKLEYKFVVLENNKEVEYTSNYDVPITDTNVLLNVSGTSNASQVDLTIPEAVVKLDSELSTVKNNLQNISTIYSNSEKKHVTLQNYIQSMSSSIDKLIKEVEDVKTKIKDL